MDRLMQIMEALRGATWLRYAAAPLLGAIIGYVTNDLALKMLFRPYEEKRIGRLRVPFTPGLIPRQKLRIARALGAVIANNLLDADTLGREALSDAALDRLRNAVTDWLAAQAADERPLRERLEARVPPERVEEISDKLTGAAAARVAAKLRGAGLGEIVVEQVVSAVRAKLAHMPMGFLFDGATESLRAAIAGAVERKIDEDGEVLVRAKLDEAAVGLLDSSVAALASGHEAAVPALTEAVLALYRELIENRLPALLAAAHLDEIIERKIASLDARELETVVFGVVRRELRAIVYLGAALGCLLGFVNLLF